MEKVKKFIRLAKMAKEIYDSDASWETKYDLIFSREISIAIRKTGVDIDYCDPDMDYEDDVRAYIRALSDKMDDLRKLPKSITGMEE